MQFVLLACTWWLNTQGEHPNQLAVARQAGTDVKMTSQVLRTLEGKGLIEREVDPADTRAKRLRVTDTGAELAPARSPPSSSPTRTSSSRYPSPTRSPCSAAWPTPSPEAPAAAGRLSGCAVARLNGRPRRRGHGSRRTGETSRMWTRTSKASAREATARCSAASRAGV